MSQSGSDHDIRRPTVRNKEGHRPSAITDGDTPAYSIIKKRENGSEGSGGRSTQRKCGGEKLNCMRGVGLQRSHDNGSLSRCTLGDW